MTIHFPPSLVVVGSTSPIKINVLKAVWPNATVEAIVVKSIVPEQPRGRCQTENGATYRAQLGRPDDSGPVDPLASDAPHLPPRSRPDPVRSPAREARPPTV